MTITINWRKYHNGNSAVQPYDHLNVDVFLHEFDDGDEDDTVLLVEQEWLDENPQWAGYARSYIDGTIVNPEGVFEHFRIDDPETKEAF